MVLLFIFALLAALLLCAVAGFAWAAFGDEPALALLTVGGTVALLLALFGATTIAVVVVVTAAGAAGAAHLTCSLIGGRMMRAQRD